ncbi:Tfp pilus assembly protein PilW [Anaerohalosphaera lusitana]|uniref:Tfp pilus assembly protein PilW n=1 Tax=Anaerohalosphaera lusitana TaxID=1936003 RepID=A0A1U9NP43_9BACT|nr:prepilin-type N-terminal cleavage/methylation domain-containing protein [Anaerohalosphaera lusitana]AQT69567.1 Tfp pilus assembly protein PilW [Anaerohalosphaera lusitana]
MNKQTRRELNTRHSGVRARSGFTMVEILIALSVTAMLMTAVALAFDASVKNYTTNENLYKAVNNARQALTRMTTELRTAQAVATSEGTSQLSMVNSAGDDITYAYDSNNQTLELITNDDTTDSDYIVCRNVTAVDFQRTTVPDEPGVVRDVQLSITLDIGDVSRTIATAAVLRRNLN